MITVPDQDPAPPTAEWLTLAEIAAELRLSPATIRSWVAKGALPAKRAGRRKWLVLRADLDEMLRAEAEVRAHPSPPPKPGDPGRARVPRQRETITAPNVWPDVPEEEKVDPEDWLAVAEHEWLAALSSSQMAPPDAWFAGRLQFLADTAARKAGALALLDDDEVMQWDREPAVDSLVLSYELRPGGNRPGPPDLWAEFDRRVDALARAMQVARGAPIRLALEQLSVTLQDLADEIRSYRGHGGNWEERPAPSTLAAPEPPGRGADVEPGATERSVS